MPITARYRKTKTGWLLSDAEYRLAILATPPRTFTDPPPARAETVADDSQDASELEGGR